MHRATASEPGAGVSRVGRRCGTTAERCGWARYSPVTKRRRKFRRKLGGTASGPRPSDLGPRAFSFLEVRAMAKTERTADHGDEALYALRHSAAHVMAGAVLELFPGAKFGFGPPVQDGFYYDFDLPRALTPDDLGKIEEKMREVVKRDTPFKRAEMSVADALKFFGERKQDYKVEQIQKLSGADSEDEAAS